jgi:CRISPR-associated endonuclease/helicase Cas3
MFSIVFELPTDALIHRTFAMDMDQTFLALTGNLPFPWQRALYLEFADGRFPTSCNLPTGLGKTSVVAIWLIALAQFPDRVPRRLVYVVNRRTVVDQTTIEVETYRKALQSKPELRVMRESLSGMCAIPLDNEPPLALSTLRGQFADNREWSSDPARPAVIVGTVDMIGSRLLFSGYGVGFKAKPLHAGFLGQDVLLVHDEAHLEPAFQDLLVAVEAEQKRCGEFRTMRVLELSATSRGTGEIFGLSDADRADGEIAKRITACKTVSLIPVAEEKKELADRIAMLAKDGHIEDRAVLVFVRRVEDVEKIVKQLPKGATQQLTGTLRGLERDRMADPRRVTGCPIFARFMKLPRPDAPESEQWKIEPQSGTVYLVCTSAGEVGVNISSDHLVCDLSTFDSMAQRFGRVNRFGNRNDSRIQIVHPTEFGDDDLDARRARTLALLRRLDGNGSPQSLSEIPLDERLAAFAPKPKVLPTSDILFDAWAMTTIKGPLPGRPPVEPFLHGIDERQVPETHFAWRYEVALLFGKVAADNIEELLDHASLRSHELLRVTTFGKGRAYDQLAKIAERNPKSPVWIIEPDGSLVTDKTIAELVMKRGTDFVVPLAGRTVVLPPQAGGLSANGTLDGDEPYSTERVYDVAGLALDAPLWRFQVRVDGDGESRLEPVAAIDGFPAEFRAETTGGNRLRDLNNALREWKEPAVRVTFSLKCQPIGETDDDEPNAGVHEYLLVQPIPSRKDSSEAPVWPALDTHLQGVRDCALAITQRLRFEPSLARAIQLAGAWHDLGKGRSVWQRGAGNDKDQAPVAKTLHGRAPENLNRYRHELGSLLDICGADGITQEFEQLPDAHRDLVLHLVAAHHGRARPHFPETESHVPGSPAALAQSVAQEVPPRFARLQQQFGRWGLAFVESIVRAADALDSRRIETAPLGEPLPGDWPQTAARVLKHSAHPHPKQSIRIHVDPSNPGQFFACCGLLELADRIRPGAEAWFEGREFCIASPESLDDLLDALVECSLTNTMTTAQHARFQTITAMTEKERNAIPGVGEELKTLEELLRESPIVLGMPFAITLDWFADEFAGGSRFKTWAGRQSVLNIATAMKEALKAPDWRNEACLSFAVRDCGLPFNFDSDLGAQGGAIDIGFSFDPLAGSALTRIASMARPALELLAFIGLQRFRPSEVRGENRFIYTAWNRPLPIAVAAAFSCNAVSHGSSSIMNDGHYEFRLLYRTKYLKSFLPSIPLAGGSDE